MFTGLIEACVPVLGVERRASGLALRVRAPEGWVLGRGASVAVSGACLTAVGGAARELAFDVSSETLARTWFGALEPGRQVNLERALRLGDRLDGHLVAGHVDGRGRIVAVEDPGDGGRTFRFEVEPELERYLVDKGSVTLDGISLTVVAPQGPRFAVAVIPETLARTSLGVARVGDAVNVEADLVAKWIERLARAARGDRPPGT